jgi:hypothetical protein
VVNRVKPNQTVFALFAVKKIMHRKERKMFELRQREFVLSSSQFVVNFIHTSTENYHNSPLQRR